MRRSALHIAAALLAFTVGFLTTDRPGNLIFALPLALSVFVLSDGVPRPRLKRLPIESRLAPPRNERRHRP